LLRTQLQPSLGNQGVAQLHLRAAAWHERSGLILEAIHHASLAADDEMVERLIKRHYLEMMNRGEMSWVRSWMGKLGKELIYRRPGYACTKR
jgi:LuxR family maltose regulon positive regulatory protein